MGRNAVYYACMDVYVFVCCVREEVRVSDSVSATLLSLLHLRSLLGPPDAAAEPILLLVCLPFLSLSLPAAVLALRQTPSTPEELASRSRLARFPPRASRSATRPASGEDERAPPVLPGQGKGTCAILAETGRKRRSARASKQITAVASFATTSSGEREGEGRYAMQASYTHVYNGLDFLYCVFL